MTAAPSAASSAADRRPLLVQSFGRMGDIMRSISVVRMVRERHPDQPIDFLARRPGDEIARFVPEIRNVYVEETPHKSVGLAEKWAFARAMRRERYQRAYILGRSFKAALTPWLAGIPERVGYLGEGRLGLINRLRRGERGYAHEAHRLCALALEPGEDFPARLPPPRLVVSAEDIARWRAGEGLENDPRPVLAIAPGASFEPRRWPIERFVALAQAAHARGWAVWVLVDRSEAHLAEAIRATVPTPAFKGASVSDLILKIAAADLFLGNESGPLHVAAATSTPCVGLLGPTRLDDFGPLNPIVVVEPSSLTHAHTGKNGLVRSMLDIAYADVESAVIRAMAAARQAR